MLLIIRYGGSARKRVQYVTSATGRRVESDTTTNHAKMNYRFCLYQHLVKNQNFYWRKHIKQDNNVISIKNWRSLQDRIVERQFKNHKLSRKGIHFLQYHTRRAFPIRTDSNPTNPSSNLSAKTNSEICQSISIEQLKYVKSYLLRSD